MKKENGKQRERRRGLSESQLQQIREDARRPVAVNLAEGIELSEFLSTFPEESRPTDAEAREMLRRRNAKT